MRTRTAGVTALVLLAHAAVIGLFAPALAPPTARDNGAQVILASVVQEAPMPAAPAATHAAPRAAAPPQAMPLSAPPLDGANHRTDTTAAKVATHMATNTAAPTGTTDSRPAPDATQGTTTGAEATARGEAAVQAGRPSLPPAAVVPPSSDADYLRNPPPAYPRMSRRMGEQGTVLLRVLINAEGRAEQAEIRSSSGHPRLDEAALETVRRWRYRPGQRAGVPEAMWFSVPIRFVLD